MSHSDPEKDKAYKRAYYQKNANKIKERAKIWNQENRERRTAIQQAYESNPQNHERLLKIKRERQRAVRSANPDEALRKQREYNSQNSRLRHAWRLKNVYGISLEDYDRMLESQGGGCAICGGPPGKGRGGPLNFFCVDHDHQTGRVRGLLCVDHNTGLGRFEDSLNLLLKAVEYLKRDVALGLIEHDSNAQQGKT